MTTFGPEPHTNAQPQPEPRHASEPSETLYVGSIDRPDEFELVSVGHKGGEGLVFRARYQGSLPRPVVFAVKQLIAPPGGTATTWPEERVVERWREQLKLLRLLHHPHLVGYRELIGGWPPHPAGTCSGEPPVELRTWYLVMEWVEGPSLHELVRAGGSDIAERMVYVAQVAEAIEYLHSGIDTAGMALLHRDVKPGNVIVNAERGAVLVDYGLMRVEEPTLTELPAWTGPYLAPEVHADKTRTSRASDLWAVAGTAFFAVTGRQPSPFDAPGMRRELADHLAGAVADVNGLVSSLMEVLDRTPDDRPKSPAVWATKVLREANKVSLPSAAASAGASTIDGLAGAHDSGVAHPASAEAMSPPSRGRRRVGVSGSVALVALVVAGSVFAAVKLSGQTKGTPHPGGKTTPSTIVPTTVVPSPPSLGDVVISTSVGHQASPPLDYDVQVAKFGGSHGPVADAINASLSQAAGTLIAQFEQKVAQQYAQQGAPPSLAPLPARASLTCKIDTRLVDARVAAWQYDCATWPAGAMHPVSSPTTLNFDLRTGREVALSDLFRSGADYLSVLSSGAIQQLSYLQGYQPDMARQGASPVDKNFAAFAVTTEGLQVTFADYQVGPYSIGTPTVFYAWQQLAPLLAPDGIAAAEDHVVSSSAP
jgi:serine/threonine protein kinase